MAVSVPRSLPMLEALHGLSSRLRILPRHGRCWGRVAVVKIRFESETNSKVWSGQSPGEAYSWSPTNRSCCPFSHWRSGPS